MDSEHAREIAGPAEVTPVVEFDGVSKWYGNVIGLNKLTVRIPPGITGLLGPNGAGKSTLLQLATGQLRPSQGRVRVLGHRTWNNSALDAARRPLSRAGRLLRMDDRLRLRPHLCQADGHGPVARPRRPPRRPWPPSA